MSTAPLGQAPQARWKQTRSQISSSRYSHLQNVMDLRISQLVVAPIRVELHCTPTIDLPVSAGFRSLSDKPCSSSLGFTASMQHSGQDNTIVSANKSIRFPISPVLLAYLFPQAAASDSIGHPIMDVQSIMSTQCQVASRLQNPAGISKTQN